MENLIAWGNMVAKWITSTKHYKAGHIIKSSKKSAHVKQNYKVDCRGGSNSSVMG